MMTVKRLFSGFFLAMSLYMLLTYQLGAVLSVLESMNKVDKHGKRGKLVEKFTRPLRYHKPKIESLNDFLGKYHSFILLLVLGSVNLRKEIHKKLRTLADTPNISQSKNICWDFVSEYTAVCQQSSDRKRRRTG